MHRQRFVRKASKAGFAGKGVIASQGSMGVFRRLNIGAEINPGERLVGATAPVLWPPRTRLEQCDPECPGQAEGQGSDWQAAA